MMSSISFSTLLDILHNLPDESGKATLDVLLNALIESLEHNDNANRHAAAIMLSEMENPRAVQALINTLQDPDDTLRELAVKALGKIGDPVATSALVERLYDSMFQVRREALASLESMQTALTLPDLINLLGSDDPFIRRYAATALEKQNNATSITALIARLYDDDSRVSLAAAVALGTIGTHEAVEPLYQIALDERTYYRLRDAAIRALVQIYPDDINERLFALLDDPSRDVRQLAIESLTHIQNADQVRTLLEMAEWHRSLYTPVRDALVRVGNEVVETAMIENLHHLRGWIRSLAVDVLGSIGSKKAVPELVNLLENDTHEIGVLAAYALGQIGDERAVSALITALSREAWLIEVAAASALSLIQTPQAQETARHWYNEQSPGNGDKNNMNFFDVD